jgi:hypothetical protein
MGLQGWDIFVEFGEIKGKGNDAEMAMETFAEPEYYKTTLTVDLSRLHEIDINTYVRHEFLHTILWLYTHAAEELCVKKAQGTVLKLEERVVSDLERMPLWEMLYKMRKKQ